MIKNQWYAVLESNELPRGKVLGATRLGEKLVFWRDSQGRPACLQDTCPHRGVALSAGKLIGDYVQCPFHGFEYDPSGRARLVPAIGADTQIPRHLVASGYPVVEANDFIFLWWGDRQEATQPPRFFDNIGEGFSYGSARDSWKAHYSRVIENQLDVAHLPFVHYNTIGRDHRTVVDGPLVEWLDADKFMVYTFNRHDDGSPPRKASQLSPAGREFHLEFIFPNLWQNYIGQDVRVVAAFVPVDEEHTILYLRFYQKFLGLPVLSQIINRLAMPFNVYIAHQDRRVVETQLPKRSALRMEEQLIQADNPIIEYRRRREELIAARVHKQKAGSKEVDR